MSTAESWTLLTDAEDGASSLDRFLAARVAAKLRTKWTYTERCTIEFKSGPHWRETGRGIAMPDKRENVSPEGGAAALVAMAHEVYDRHDGKRVVRVVALGESQSGETSKILWVHQLDFNDHDDDEIAQLDPRKAATQSKLVEDAADKDVLRRAAEDAHGHWKEAVELVHKVVRQTVELSSQLADNNAGLVEAMRLDNQEKREAREHAERMASDERNAARTDLLFQKLIGVGEGILEDYLRSKMGVPSGAFEGTYSSRLKTIFDKVPADKRDACKEILGDEVWEILQDAAGGVSDEAFRALVRRVAAKMTNHGQTFMRLAAAMGEENKGLVAALAKLLQTASA